MYKFCFALLAAVCALADGVAPKVTVIAPVVGGNPFRDFTFGVTFVNTIGEEITVAGAYAGDSLTAAGEPVSLWSAPVPLSPDGPYRFAASLLNRGVSVPVAGGVGVAEARVGFSSRDVAGAPRGLFSRAGLPPSERAVDLGSTILQSELVWLDVDTLRNTVVGAELPLNFGSLGVDVPVTVRKVTHGDGRVVVRAECSQPAGHADIVVVRDIAVINLRLDDGRFFQTRVHDGARGLHVLHRVNPVGFPDEADAQAPPLLGAALAADTADGGSGEVKNVTGHPDGSGTEDDPYVFDVLVAYTTAARQGAGGTEAILAEIALAEGDSNEIYRNSKIWIRAKVVSTMEVAYGELSQARDMVYNLQRPHDGELDDVLVQREGVYADFVSLWVASAGDTCGMGYVMDTLTDGFKANAVHIVRRDCATAFFSFTHELAHNMGCGHDREHADRVLFAYSYGSRWNKNQYRSIMSYTPGERVKYFSGPDVFHMGMATGSTDADNARTIRQSAPTFVKWYTAPTQATAECGNGKVEQGEECDSTAECCNQLTCKFRLYPTPCGKSQPICGRTVCDGRGQCILEKYNGTKCDDGLACNGPETCYDGLCRSLGNPCSSMPACQRVCTEGNNHMPVCGSPAGAPCSLSGEDDLCMNDICASNGTCIAGGCPNACSGRGTCCRRMCTCDVGFEAGPNGDCSVGPLELGLDKPTVAYNFPTPGTRVYFHLRMLPGYTQYTISAAMAQGSVRLYARKDTVYDIDDPEGTPWISELDSAGKESVTVEGGVEADLFVTLVAVNATTDCTVSVTGHQLGMLEYLEERLPSLSTGAIAGLAIGSVIFLLALSALIILLCKKCRCCAPKEGAYRRVAGDGLLDSHTTSSASDHGRAPRLGSRTPTPSPTPSASEESDLGPGAAAVHAMLEQKKASKGDGRRRSGGHRQKHAGQSRRQPKAGPREDEIPKRAPAQERREEREESPAKHDARGKSGRKPARDKLRPPPTINIRAVRESERKGDVKVARVESPNKGKSPAVREEPSLGSTE